MPPNFKEQVGRLELSVEGLLKLLGGSAEQRERFWEIMKGITSQAHARLVENALAAAEQSATTTWSSLSALHGVAARERQG